MLQGGEDLFAAAVVDKNHEHHGHAPEDVKTDQSLVFHCFV
jgi:hypothetical protein